ncbi:16S rRNA (guanine(527)-N(7))-methyltransferase RsmG [Bdellovibrio sp. KM01]|uniref:16S rRNA (guanine(527)-N(7))-methyltransferase RsmG n=1 Tax=Bdellovibrio sp. KM01 TaxID=2748865 RepID=UPI0015E9A18B|nr:RsmG family class I SAM-dependent methyltransferase [Bdellovibrio sp. KM01]QLY25747.1 class I SAM-dependent methyltransferase [Bdellovibrio sp. KM01]
MSFEQRVPTILDLGFRKEAIDQLKSYIDLLWSSNEELNLISRKMTFDELLDNHVVDCLLPLKYFPKNIKVAADFGSGGGLPGVIYAIQFPEVQFHLYEKSVLKQNFLNNCKKIAPNLHVHGEIPKDLGAVDVVTARGFKPVDVILDVSRTYYAKKGKYFLLKARKEKIDEELLLARKKFKDLSVTIEPLKSPVLDVERHLVLI